MAEPSKSQSRQKKLTSGDFLDSEDKNIYDLQKDIDMQIKNIKIEVLDTEYLDEDVSAQQTPIKFSIKVEVEEFDEHINNITLENDTETKFVAVPTPCKEETSPTDYQPDGLDVDDSNINFEIKCEGNLSYLYEGNETEVCLEADHIAKTSNNIVDKILAMEVRNFCGVLARPKQESTLLESQIYGAYKQWITWCNSSKFYEPPLFYKCYICEKSWWHLAPLMEHAKEHISQIHVVYLEVPPCSLRQFMCNVVLATNQSEPERFIYTEGDCWRCGNSYSFHEKINDLGYKCKTCSKYFAKCKELYQHENICSKNKNIHSKSNIVCKICDYMFASHDDLAMHFNIYHTVRSDVFMWTTNEICFNCNKKPYIFGEKCSKSCYSFECGLCFRRFASRTILRSHESYMKRSVRCSACKTVLPNKCMEIQHYITHTDKFKLVYKCALCTDVFLLWEPNSMKMHRLMWHENEAKNKNYYELVLFPTKCMEKLKMVNPEPITLSLNGNAAQPASATYAEEPMPVSEIKQEILDDENCEDDNRYDFEGNVSAYNEFMTNIFHGPGQSEDQIRTQIKAEVIDSSDEDMEHRDTDDGGEPRLVIDTSEREDWDLSTNERRVTRNKQPRYDKRVPKMYTCSKCGYQGVHRDYKDHLQTTCTTIRKTRATGARKSREHQLHRCSRCKVTFLSLNGYICHFPKAHGYEKLSCPVCACGFDAADRFKLPSHFLTHVKQLYVKLLVIESEETASHPTPDFRYRCNVCKQEVEKVNFFSHWETHFEVKHVNVNEKIDNDDHAPPTNVDIDELISKVLTARTSYIHRTCTICDRHFNRVNDSKRHLIEHLLTDAYRNKPLYGCLRCQICKEMHMKPDSYKKHMREHAALPIYQCGLCNKCFSDSSNFVKHKKIHNVKVLVCDICKNKYQAKASLEKHMLIHKATKPITCTLCSKTFYIESAFKKHNRIVHERYRAMFKCLICNSRFRSLKDKWDHMWLVHKERKNKADCPICEKRFRKYQDVKRHIRIEHKSVQLKDMRLKDQQNEDVTEYIPENCKFELGEQETLIVYE